MTSPVPLSFVLVSTHAPPDPVRVIQAAKELGLGLAHEMGDPDSLNFQIEGKGTLIVALMATPHPDALHMPVGPTSPDPMSLAQHVGHYVVTAFDLPGDHRQVEVTMSVAAAALVRVSPAVAAKLGDGAIFHNAEFFANAVEKAAGNTAPEITVDITVAQELGQRMSFLTHGLSKYDREEFYLTAPVAEKGALEYLSSLVQWMISDPDKVLPTGDTVGRTDDEQILVQRVPSPIEGKAPVIRLDLDTKRALTMGPRSKNSVRSRMMKRLKRYRRK